MAATEQDKQATGGDSRGKRKELMVFLFLTVVVAPVMAVMIVGGYGLMVWIYQMIAGPPTQ
jgi:nitrate reductase NapE